MNLGIEGKIAVVTGGASGIGRETARRLASEGTRIALVDINGRALERAANDIGEPVIPVQADLTDRSQVSGVAETIRDRLGQPSILVCAAGITGAKGDPLNLSDGDWLEAWQTDFMSVVRTMRAFVPAMARSGWGRAVVLTSENAMQPYEEEAVYNTAKAALLNFSKGLSHIYARQGVLINAVSPAFIETPMTDEMMDKRAERMGVSREEAINTFLKEERPHLELKRRGKPEEVAAVIAFLCSEVASFVVGANYRVDGGSVATMSV